jgi:hypothetical protein
MKVFLRKDMEVIPALCVVNKIQINSKNVLWKEYLEDLLPPKWYY